MFDSFEHVVAIYIADEMYVEVILIEFKRLSYHCRTEVRATNTNVHHIGKSFTAITFALTTDNLFAELFNLVFYSRYFGHYILAIYVYHAIFGRAKGGVQNRTFFGVVDKVATEVFANSVL